MRLARPFYQLPVTFDVARLQSEIAALPAQAWAPHPDGLAGNSAVRLISVDGAETDGHHGQMRPTAWLEDSPYLRQVLAGFGVVWSRSRLMRLAACVGVPEHADVNHHWHTRVRLHIPIVTWPQVRFHCDGQVVHMAEGEAWIFDNWRRHHVENLAEAERIHLVADTTGTAAFWRFACGAPPPRAQWARMPWIPGVEARPLTEGDQRTRVMPAAEVQLLVDDLRAELTAAPDSSERRAQASRFSAMLEDFLFDWRQLCVMHGVGGRSLPDFQRLVSAVRETAGPLADGLVMRTNGVDASQVLEKRVLQYLVDA